MKEEDSFQQCKGELEKELGITDIPPPSKPMNAYMRYYLERSSEQRANGHKEFATSLIAAEWNALPANKRDYYQQIYEIRRREQQSLQAQFQLLTEPKKVLSPYSRFIKKRYLQYSREYPTHPSTQLTKLANEDWRKLSLPEKDKLREEVDHEKDDAELNLDHAEQIAEYRTNLERYHQQLKEDKERVLRKYGLSAVDKAQARKVSQQRVAQTRNMIKDIQVSISKKKSRENVKRKVRKESRRIYKIVEKQRDQEKRAIRAELDELRKESRNRKRADAVKEEGKPQEIGVKTKQITKDAPYAIVGKTGETFLRVTRSKK